VSISNQNFFMVFIPLSRLLKYDSTIMDGTSLFLSRGVHTNTYVVIFVTAFTKYEYHFYMYASASACLLDLLNVIIICYPHNR
jgi:hypothetical protein